MEKKQKTQFPDTINPQCLPAQNTITPLKTQLAGNEKIAELSSIPTAIGGMPSPRFSLFNSHRSRRVFDPAIPNTVGNTVLETQLILNVYRLKTQLDPQKHS